jgi:PAS domain S-box-containing protein
LAVVRRRQEEFNMGSEPQNNAASPAGPPGALTPLDETSWGLFDWNLLDGTCVLSPSYKALLGYAEHELADHIGAFYALIHPDDRPLMRRDFEDNISAKDRDVRHLFRIINKSGGLRWIEGRGRVSTNEHGVPVRMFGIAFDVTAQHEARATLLAAKAFSDQVIEASLDAILAFTAPSSPATPRSSASGAGRAPRCWAPRSRRPTPFWTPGPSAWCTTLWPARPATRATGPTGCRPPRRAMGTPTTARGISPPPSCRWPTRPAP